MIIIACTDVNGGMMFNNRRQSKDIEVLNRISALTRSVVLFMNEYSRQMFGGLPQILTDNDFLRKAGKGDYCFIENSDIAPFADRIEKIIIYNWNRRYPSDFRFDTDLETGWRLTASTDFKGKSHDRITENIYERIV